MRAVVELSLIALVIGSAGAHSDEPLGTLTDAALDRWAKYAAENGLCSCQSARAGLEVC